tara:strand:+ start:447 stop:767 length:321 start_codon:yes stop_codon:yes gene_type:complete
MSGGHPAFNDPEDWAGQETERRRERLRRRRRADRIYAEVFAGEAGGGVLDDLIARFAGESYSRGDPHHTAYREGQRSVVEHIARAIARTRRDSEDSEEESHERDEH